MNFNSSKMASLLTYNSISSLSPSQVLCPPKSSWITDQLLLTSLKTTCLTTTCRCLALQSQNRQQEHCNSVEPRLLQHRRNPELTAATWCKQSQKTREDRECALKKPTQLIAKIAVSTFQFNSLQSSFSNQMKSSWNCTNLERRWQTGRL